MIHVLLFIRLNSLCCFCQFGRRPDIWICSHIPALFLLIVALCKHWKWWTWRKNGKLFFPFFNRHMKKKTLFVYGRSKSGNDWLQTHSAFEPADCTMKWWSMVSLCTLLKQSGLMINDWLSQNGSAAHPEVVDAQSLGSRWRKNMLFSTANP